MSYPISLDMQGKQAQSQKQTQRLMMTPQMQQAIYLLQLPVMELSNVIENEMEQNPVLEYLQEEDVPEEYEEREEETPVEKEMEFDEKHLEILKQLDDDFRGLYAESGPFLPKNSSEDEKRKSFLESIVQEEPTLFEHLMTQAREAFQDPDELKMAEVLIGYFDERGFLKTPLEEIAQFFDFDREKLLIVLTAIQKFEPLGVGARDLKEALLIQLKIKEKENGLAYKIIDKHFDDLLHNRIPVIQKGLKVSAEDIQQAVDSDIAKLDIHPGTSYSRVTAPGIVPDVTLKLENEIFRAEVNEDTLQPMRLNRKYLKMLEDPSLSPESKDFIKSKILSAKWLLKNIHQRNETILKMANFLAEKQKKFFSNPEGKLVPLTMKTIADELNLHESTIARAVANKYIETPRGLFPLRFFFSNAYMDGLVGEDISSKTVKEKIHLLIEGEDKKKPLSDEGLSRKLKEIGINCARRTVAKYRAEMNMGNAQQRKKY